MTDDGNSTDETQPKDKIAHRSVGRIELARQVAAYEHAALKTLYVLNGGGALALLVFVGRVWTEDGGNQQVLIGVGGTIAYFVFGLIIAAIATFAGYMQQQWFFKGSGVDADNRYNIAGHVARYVAWTFSVASLIGFAGGCFVAIDAFVAGVRTPPV